jgi:hypothetical protein
MNRMGPGWTEELRAELTSSERELLEYTRTRGGDNRQELLLTIAKLRTDLKRWRYSYECVKEAVEMIMERPQAIGPVMMDELDDALRRAKRGHAVPEQEYLALTQHYWAKGYSHESAKARVLQQGASRGERCVIVKVPLGAEDVQVDGMGNISWKKTEPRLGDVEQVWEGSL